MPHIFSQKKSISRTLEHAVAGGFRTCTYIIILFASWIFLDIIWKGGQTVFRTSFPFVNVEFFTQFPKALYVVHLDGKDLSFTGEELDKWKETQRVPQIQKTGEVPFAGVMIPTFEASMVIPEFDVSPYSYSAGGILPSIVGTLLLVVGSMAIALVIGISAAVYLSEYAKQGRLVTSIRLAILNLAGVPSIVFGLFGVGLFVVFLKWNVSLMAGWFTLAFMVLPVIITASEESLRAVPKGFREGSLALGATKWQSIRSNVLPYALPGMLTSSILGIARVAGETAPIMFTAAYALRDQLPWQGISNPLDLVFQGVNALPYHIYVVGVKQPPNPFTAKIQYGTSFVLLMLVVAVAAASILLRMRMRSKYKW